MSTSIDDMFYHGRKVTNYVKGATNFSEGTDEHKITVPTGKRWILIGGVINVTQNATLDVTIKDASDNMLMYLNDEAAGTGYIVVPGSKANKPANQRGIIMIAGEYVHVEFGAAQDANAHISLQVIEYSTTG